VTLLADQIDGASASEEELLFEPELVVRNSTGIARKAAVIRPAARGTAPVS
jgi:hypothetical protein